MSGESMKSEIYQQDFLRWAEEQLALFRAGNFSDLDLENIFAEIEDMGKKCLFQMNAPIPYRWSAFNFFVRSIQLHRSF